MPTGRLKVNGGRSGFLDRQVSSCFRFELIPHQNVRCEKGSSQKTLPAAEFRHLGCLSAIGPLSVALDHERPGGKVETRLLKFAAGATLRALNRSPDLWRSETELQWN
jgi:hypothetical protein